MAIILKELTSEYFFDLSDFEHSGLFQKSVYVWETLALIKDYLENYSLGEKETPLPEGVYLEKPELITIGKNCTIEPGSFIKGPCIIEDGAQIRHGAYVRGNGIIGKNAVVGHCTEVKNSIFLNNAQAGHFAYVGDSILGNGCNLGAGTKCANLKLDRSNIIISFKTQRIKTGRRKFGAIIGDNAQIGCNSVTNPGTLLGKGALCRPCINIHGFVSEKEIYSSKKNYFVATSP